MHLSPIIFLYPFVCVCVSFIICSLLLLDLSSLEFVNANLVQSIGSGLCILQSIVISHVINKIIVVSHRVTGESVNKRCLELLLWSANEIGGCCEVSKYRAEELFMQPFVSGYLVIGGAYCTVMKLKCKATLKFGGYLRECILQESKQRTWVRMSVIVLGKRHFIILSHLTDLFL